MHDVAEISTHFGNSLVAPIGPHDRRVGTSPIEYRLSYINNLSVPVTIVLRSGLKFVLQPQLSMLCSKLTMRVDIIIHHSVKVNIQKLLSAVNDESTQELKTMREAFSLQVSENTYGGATLTIDYPITLETLRENGNVVYYNEIDCIVSLNSFDDTPPHPYSEEGRRQNIVTSSGVSGDNTGFGYSVTIIDSNSIFGSRFINVCNKVYRVKAVKDRQKRDGVYVVTNHAVGNDSSAMTVETKHHTFEDADNDLDLFRTIEEAQNLGDLAAAKKIEMSTLEHEIATQKIELQKAKHKADMLELERTKEVNILEIEKARHKEQIDELRATQEHVLKIERESLKNAYEEKSYQRKDGSELLKMIPTIIMGLGSIFLALKMF